VATITLLRRNIDFRSNIGFAEVAGGSGTARFTFLDPAGNTVGTAEYPVVPFTHFQTALPVESALQHADVTVSGGARIVAYGSVVDNHSGDGMYIPAARPLAGVAVIPAVHSAGVNGTFWRTDLWTTTTIREDVISNGLQALSVSEPLAGSRTWTPSGDGTCGEFIAPIAISSGIAFGQPPLQLIGIEQSVSRRTNIGVINVGRARLGVRLIAYDAVGRERGRSETFLGPGSLFQVPLSGITASLLPVGRVAVEVISTTGAAVAYASVVDNRSSDSYVVIARKGR
jgi:hypothetical protein